jgi:hypothetical protein
LEANSVTSFEVFTIPQGLESNRNRDYLDFKDVLRPLRLLRNIQGFNIREATILEVPRCVLGQHVNIPEFWSQWLDPDLVLELKQLAVSNAPLQFATDMYPFLLDYTEAFEQYAPFMMEMDLETWARRDSDTLSEEVKGQL